MVREVHVTGLGMLTGLGSGWRESWLAIREGRNGVRPWRIPLFKEFAVRYASAVSDDVLLREEERLGLDSSIEAERRTRMGIVAAMQAIEDRGGKRDHLRGPRTAVLVGTGVPERDPGDLLSLGGGSAEIDELLVAHRAALSPRTGVFLGSDQLAAGIAEHIQATGPVLNLTTACASASQAIGMGLRMIRRGEADRVVCGGADSVLNSATMFGLLLLGAPSVAESFGDRLSRPFDVGRSGFVAGEGAGFVVLESTEAMRESGSSSYAELCGYGSSMDAHRITAPLPAGEGAALAMSRALQDAAMEAGEVDHINAHGTSTALNDVAETLAIKAVFPGNHRQVSIASNKSQFGHLIAAAGGPEFIATVLAVRDGIVPPTINLENPDPECDLDYTPGRSRMRQIRAALSNSFGFGGWNSCLAVRRVDR